MKRIKHSWELARTSLTILREHKRLFLLFLLSLLPVSIFILIISVGILTAGISAGGFLEMMSFLYLEFFAWFLVIFFNVAFTHGVLTLLEGGRSFSIRESLKEALMRMGLIFKWIGFTVVVILLFNCLRWIPTAAAGVVSYILSLAWLCATYFIVPIMVFENLTATEALERSLRVLRKTWMELIVFGAIIGGAAILLVAVLAAGVGLILIVGEKACLNHWFLQNAVMPMPILWFINYLIPAILGLLWGVLCIVLIIFLGVMPLTYASVLYSYAITGMSPGEFQTKPEDKSND